MSLECFSGFLELQGMLELRHTQCVLDPIPACDDLLFGRSNCDLPRILTTHDPP